MPFEFLLNTIKSLLNMLLNPVVLIPVVIAIIIELKHRKDYKYGAYFKITGLPFGQVKRDIGRYGEYLIYKNLKSLEKEGVKFLFNVYIPKTVSETTEIDVLMICPKGIFVFESKNYSGWIFGSEHQRNWYQTLPKGRGSSHKESFYNPIMQNHNHIKHLKTFIGDDIPIYSVIAFSQRCTLKNVRVESQDIKVINRDKIYSVVTEICKKSSSESLSEENIEEIYNKLYPFTQADEAIKLKHINDIKDKIEQPLTRNATLQINNTLKEDKQVKQDDCKKETVEKICPKCGGELILKTATKGANVGKQFYGCSKFPQCKYMLSYNETEL